MNVVNTAEAMKLLRRHATLVRNPSVPYVYEEPRGCLLTCGLVSGPGWNHVILLPTETPARLLDNPKADAIEHGRQDVAHDIRYGRRRQWLRDFLFMQAKS